MGHTSDRLASKYDDSDAQPLVEYSGDANPSGKRTTRIIVITTFVVFMLGLLALGLTLGLVVGGKDKAELQVPKCTGPGYNYTMVESIPFGLEHALTYPPGYGSAYNHSTAVAWSQLIGSATKTIDILCFYMTLNATDDGSPEDSPEDSVKNGHVVGMAIYNQLIEAAERGVRVRIIESYPSITLTTPSLDVQRLIDGGYATVRTLNMTMLNYGTGVMHDKMMIFDEHTFYVGSANLDWRSLTQVKELGIVIAGDCLADDAMRQYDFFWKVAKQSAFPQRDGGEFATKYWAYFSADSPASLLFDNDPANQTTPSSIYLTASPEAFCPHQRAVDLDAVQSLMDNATSTISISVMDYIPAVVFSEPNYYWPDIDDSIRAAAFTGVNVRMLISLWNYSMADSYQYLLSLDALDTVEVRYMKLPPQPGISPVPYTRVNHCKYMVTDDQVLISTSNWSGDYFVDTIGASSVSNDPAMVAQVQQVFDRDWSSTYAIPILEVQPF